MKKRSNRKAGFLALALFLGAGALFAGFPLWVDSPERSNLKDPKNPKAVLGTPTPAGTPTSTPTATNTPVVCMMWDDFEESGASWAPFVSDFCGPRDYDCSTNYCDADWDSTVPGVRGLSTAKAHSGTQSWYMPMVSNASLDCLWGLPYFGATTSTITGTGDLDMTCGTNFFVWIWTNKTLKLKARLVEGTGSGADSEEWLSPQFTVTGSSAWKKVSIPFANFVNGDATCPSCSTNNTFDRADIAYYWFKVMADNALADVYVDDIGVETP